ncbi:unnamed protein product [Moneuplotes crassus]|uniref:RING-type domain-containing protein n=1 Tax=Euplotes crassus TaxID=5936 RepID=A0AAD1XQ17_EUPCR|nr:unnamed protein product [Moneuplotes crassus]CAI2377008.1 unnamed protein product [Moneuplotes crassus]
MSFSQHQRATQEEGTEKLIKRNTGTIRNNILSIILILLSLYMCSSEGFFGKNCGPDIRGFLKIAVFVKLGISIYFGLVNYLVQNNKVKLRTANLMIAGLWLLTLYWHWIVLSKFYSSINDCRKVATLLWINHLLLLVDAFLNFGLCLCISCGLCIFCIAILVSLRRDAQKAKANLQIKDLLLNAAKFKRSPSEYEVGDSCPICIVEFAENENIICLPCNRGHIFHSDCIGEWVQRNNNCPICKAEITPDIIEGASMQDIPIAGGDPESRCEDLDD